MNKKSIAIKYILFLGLISDLIFKGSVINEYTIALVLLYMVIVQVRMYNSIPIHNSKAALFTLPIDLLFMVVLAIYNNISIFIYLIIIYDSMIYLEKYLSIPITVASSIYLFKVYNTGLELYEIPIILAFMLLAWIIREEYIKNSKNESELFKQTTKIDRLKSEIKAIEGSMDTAKELYTTKERNRISRELHDSIGHSLSTIVINLRAIEKMSGIDAEKTGEMTNSLLEYSKEALLNLRNTLTELKPSDISSKSIQISLEQLITNFSNLTSIHVNFRVSQNVWDMSESNELLVYRIVQEFLSNSAKHGNPKTINIFMSYGHSQLILSLKDDGIGSDDIVENVGLQGIRERVTESGGNIEYSSSAGNGFFMRVVIPRFYKEQIYG